MAKIFLITGVSGGLVGFAGLSLYHGSKFAVDVVTRTRAAMDKEIEAWRELSVH